MEIDLYFYDSPSFLKLAFFYKDLPIHVTSTDDVNDIAKECHFQLYLARRIASSRFSCRRLVLVYERIDEA